MAKTRGARDINERQQNEIIEDRKQGRAQEELAQQFSISISTVTKFLERWKIQVMSRRRKSDDRVVLLLSSIAIFSANLIATHDVSRRRTLLKKYWFLKSLIHLYGLYVVIYRLQDCMDSDPWRSHSFL